MSRLRRSSALILTRGEAEGRAKRGEASVPDAVFFAAPAVDVTEQVMRRLYREASSKAAGAVAPLPKDLEAIAQHLDRLGATYRADQRTGGGLQVMAQIARFEQLVAEGRSEELSAERERLRLDLTQDALREKGRGVDVAGFDAAMAEQKAKARAAWAGSGEAADAAFRSSDPRVPGGTNNEFDDRPKR